MNTCPARLQTLPCSLQGYGYLSEPVRLGDTTIRLMKGHGAYFPELVGDQFFFVLVEGCDGCCEQMRVTARVGDVLTVERGNGCECINSNARVSYDYTSREYIQAIAREIGINVKSPLEYDCETNTLSLDCNKLATDSDCGCGSGQNKSGEGRRGPQGPAGRNGADGISITGISIDEHNTLRWTDSKGNSHTIGTVVAAQGPRGEKGDTGPQGPAGPTGPQGDDAGKIQMSEHEDGTFELFIITPEGGTKSLGTWKPRAGTGITDLNIDSDGHLIVNLSDGAKVDAGSTIGPRGPIGHTASFGMIYRNGKVIVSGPAGAEVYLRTEGRILGSRFSIPANGTIGIDNPNTGVETVVELVYNGGVVEVGWF